MRHLLNVSSLKTAALLATALTVGLATDSAEAVDRDPDSFVWIFSQTPFGSQDSALAMSRGMAWPVIFGENETIALRPTSGFSGDYWQQIADGVGANPKAASTADGRVAGAGSLNAFVVGPTGGLSFLPFETTSVDFSTGGAVVYGSQFNGSVTGLSYPSGGPPVFDVAVSPFGDGGVISGNEFYSTLTGDFEDFDLNTPVGYAGGGDLTFDAQGRPHISDRNANVFSFDTVSAQWTAANLGFKLGGANTAIAADSQGTVGAAFVDANGDLIYGYWTNSAGWQTMIVDSGVLPDQVGLAFDYEDLPVISYSKLGSLWVAYDPIVAVPEPASLTLLAGLGLLSVTRRRRSA